MTWATDILSSGRAGGGVDESGAERERNHETGLVTERRSLRNYIARKVKLLQLLSVITSGFRREIIKTSFSM